MAVVNNELKTLLLLLDELFEEDMVALLALMSTTAYSIAAPIRRHWKPKVIGFIEDVVVNFTQKDFRTFFRVTKEEALKLTDLLECPVAGRGRKVEVMPYKQLLILLLWLGTKQSMIQIANLFGISDSTVVTIIHKVVNQLFDHRGDFIRWPSGAAVQNVMDDFESKNGLKGVIGAIDGCHIPISCPKESGSDYVNRKGFHSIILQATCSADLAITDVYCGWPGSAHDARVWRNSDLYREIEEQPAITCPGGSYLLGDSAYPLSEYVITPFKGKSRAMSAGETKFNFVHSSTRMAIEKTFGVLKGRFRRLKFLDVHDLSHAVKVTVVACMLHNFCLAGGQLEDFCTDTVINDDDDMSGDINIYPDQKSGIVKRARIMEDLLSC